MSHKPLNIVHLTAGTGNYYCGTCLRDHALVRGLIRRGNRVRMAPMYLPLVLEAPDQETAGPIQYGGINVYLQQKFSLFRGSPRRLGRWLDRPLLLHWASRRADMTKARDLGALTVSVLRGEAGRQTKELGRLVQWLESSGPVDAVCLSNVMLAGLARRIKQRLGVPVVCTLQGEDAFLDSLADPDRDEAWKILADRCRDIDAFIAVSHYYGDRMRDRLGIDSDRIQVVYNGIDLEGFELETGQDASPPSPVTNHQSPALGYLARMCPDKGLHTLVDAFIRLKASGRVDGLKLRVAGARTRADVSFVRSLQERLNAEGLSGEAEFLPNIDRDAKLAMLKSLSVFSVPATYGEAFGLYLLEALAAGVPVVQPRHGAFPELLADTGGGILVDPDDARSLSDGIESLLTDPKRAEQLAEEGRSAVFDRFGIDRMARDFERLLLSVVGGQHGT